MSTLTTDIINIVLAIILVFINGFFVAAEFALVKIRPSKLDEHGRAKTNHLLQQHAGSHNGWTHHCRPANLE